MDTMNIALPEAMKQFVQEQVAEGGYSSVSEYVRDLIRAAQKRRPRSGSTPSCSKGSMPAPGSPSPRNTGKRKSASWPSG